MLDFSCPEGMALPRTASGPSRTERGPDSSQLKNDRHSLLLRKRGKVATILVCANEERSPQSSFTQQGECATGPDSKRKCLMLDLHSAV